MKISFDEVKILRFKKLNDFLSGKWGVLKVEKVRPTWKIFFWGSLKKKDGGIWYIIFGSLEAVQSQRDGQHYRLV